MRVVGRAALLWTAAMSGASCASGVSSDRVGVYGSGDAGDWMVDSGADPTIASHEPGRATASHEPAPAGPDAAASAPADSDAGAADIDASGGDPGGDGGSIVSGPTDDGATLSMSVSPSRGTTPVVASPMVGGCAIFPADNPWNTRIDDPQAYPVHPDSATYIANMSPGTHLHADWGSWSTDQYGIPWETVPGSQPMVPMTFDVSDESDPGPYPFPPAARVEGGSGSGGDMHVLVVDTGTCTLYETYSSTYVGPGWQCSSGAKFDLGSNSLRTDGWTSADAAGLPIFPGLVRVAEVQAGAIRHALRFTVNNSQQGYIHPATHAAGAKDPSLPPMGLRVRLKASFDVSKFSGAAAVILTAMQQYGLILADNGSNWYVSGDSDDAWTPLMGGITQALSQVHGSDFEAVQTGPIQ